ncbi:MULTISPECIES: hypothetical protein [unclassified Nocardia]|uniref:hypothetical protein n=1 Tax=unclassified Nocardia TaxID=2637762 RepID=UPI00278C6711|nr:MULTISPECIES: hypothetical protein [unclassified Nocardia]
MGRRATRRHQAGPARIPFPALAARIAWEAPTLPLPIITTSELARVRAEAVTR